MRKRLVATFRFLVTDADWRSGYGLAVAVNS